MVFSYRKSIKIAWSISRWNWKVSYLYASMSIGTPVFYTPVFSRFIRIAVSEVSRVESCKFYVRYIWRGPINAVRCGIWVAYPIFHYSIVVHVNSRGNTHHSIWLVTSAGINYIHIGQAQQIVWRQKLWTYWIIQ